MTIEEIRELGFEELEKRSLEIAEETATADSEMLETLNAELDAIEERRNALNIEIEERKAAAEKVAEGKGKEIETRKEEIMTNLEVRNTPEYIEAFARYIKTGKDAECRALLTENVSTGTVPVPEFVEGTVRAAWENDEIFSRVRKSFVKGNLKVGFEVSSSDAVIHTEGSGAVSEEELVLGIVEMVPATIKKWISISTEVAAMGAEEFLRYIYDELTYRIIKAAADKVVDSIENAPADYTGGTDAVAVPSVQGTATTASIVAAEGLLSGQASDLVVITTRATAAAVKTAALSAGYAYDPFDGAQVVYTEALDTFAAASTGDTFMIVGDLAGIQANLPEGEAVKFVYDEYTLAERDLVRIIGRLYAAIEVTGPGMFAKVVK